MIHVRVTYFAVLREQRGLAEETVHTDAATCEALYIELQARHGFSLGPELVRPARNGAFAQPDDKIAEGDHLVFIPPVAGG